MHIDTFTRIDAFACIHTEPLHKDTFADIHTFVGIHTGPLLAYSRAKTHIHPLFLSCSHTQFGASGVLEEARRTFAPRQAHLLTFVDAENNIITDATCPVDFQMEDDELLEARTLVKFLKSELYKSFISCIL